MRKPREDRSPATVRVGVAGWDYADWNGVVYPARAARGFDRLAWVARFVDAIEINATFYRPVSPRVSASWVRRTEACDDFRFTAKSHRSWTHQAPAPGPREIAATLEGLEPLREAGRLGAVLLQFPQSFHHDATARDRLARLADSARGWPLVVEVRHVSWAAEETADWFRGKGLSWCAVDQPRVGRSTVGTLPRATGPVGYLRLHGRNTADWFRPDAGRDARYDYRYSPAELRDLAGNVQPLTTQVESLFVIQNNHFRGQALVNALQMKGLIEGVRPGAPQELVDTYPDLEPDVNVERTRLF